MAKAKLESKPLKGKKLIESDPTVHENELKDSKKEKKKKKRKRTGEEEAPAKIPHTTDEANVTTIKKRKTNKTQKTQQSEISDPPSRKEGAGEPAGEEDLSPEEKRILERKMKKILKKEEKKRLKEEGGAAQKAGASGVSASQQALDYLTCWTDNRAEWKFQKTRQTWLLQHMFDSEMIPDDKFAMLLDYLEGLQGTARDTTVQKALVLVQESGEAEDTAVQQRAHRAREVIQMLS